MRGGGGGGGDGIGGPNNGPVSPLRGIESRPETAHGAVGNKLKAKSDLGAEQALVASSGITGMIRGM